MWIVLQIAGSKSFTQGRNAFLAPQPVCAGGALLCSTALIFIIIILYYCFCGWCAAGVVCCLV